MLDQGKFEESIVLLSFISQTFASRSGMTEKESVRLAQLVVAASMGLKAHRANPTPTQSVADMLAVEAQEVYVDRQGYGQSVCDSTSVRYSEQSGTDAPSAPSHLDFQ